jgi:hypothetical protein
MNSTIPEGPVTLKLTFTGNEFSGTWSMEGAGGAISGRRR